MIKYSEIHYNWLRISILAGTMFSLIIFSLFIWGFNPFTRNDASQNGAGDTAKISPTKIPSPSPLISLTPTPIGTSANRDIFAKPKDSGLTHDLTLPSPTPIITLPYSSVCPTEATLFDKKDQPQGCLVRPKF